MIDIVTVRHKLSLNTLLTELVVFERAEFVFKEVAYVKSIPPKCPLGFSRVLKGALDKLVKETLAESFPPMLDVDEEDLDLSERNLKQCRRKICDGHYKRFVMAIILRNTLIDHHHLIASQVVVLDKIMSFPRGTSCGRNGLRAQHLLDCLSGDVVAISDYASLTTLVKPCGGICPIAVGTVWRRLVSKVSAVMIGHSLDGYLDELEFGVGVSGGGETILHAVNRLVEDRRDNVGLSMLLVDLKMP
uniref:Reverse transcriptase domain-containing protein n=1 Tax=Tanacetum cinerariifolium TaxID=118510 RepID=A0A6L2KP21_TANCI|nr:hypothetical protein [Tanacetum cinerariifolium]